MSRIQSYFGLQFWVMVWASSVLPSAGCCAPLTPNVARPYPTSTASAAKRSGARPVRTPEAPAQPLKISLSDTDSAIAPESTPTYDLSADILTRRDEARADLGSLTEVEVVERTFVVAASGGRAAFAGAIDVTRRALESYFNGRFSSRPQHAISVYLFRDAETFNAYCAKRWQTTCISAYGFYLHEERRIVMNVGLGVGTLTHELVHPLVAVDFPRAPTWLNEGVASLFERFYFSGKAEIHGIKNWRHPRLIQALRSKSEREFTGLSTLFAMKDEVFRGEREDLNYATARYFCQWLDEQGLLWAFYQRFRDSAADDPSGEKALTSVLGKSVAEADAEWKRWVVKL